MGDAASILRNALLEFWAGESGARLQALREPLDSEPRSRRQGRWLSSEAGSDALAEAMERGGLSAEEAEWMRRHRQAARYAIDIGLAQSRLNRAISRVTLPSGEPLELAALLPRLARADDARALSTAGREIEQALRPIALEHASAYAQAEQPWLVTKVNKPAPNPAGSATRTQPSGLLIVSAYSIEAMTTPAARDLPEEAWLAHAAAFLADTDAAAEDVLRRCMRAFRPGRLADWPLVLRALRAPDLDSSQGARQRWQRAAAWLRGLGFDRELQARLRAEPDRGSVLPIASVLALSIPRDVRVAQTASDWGVASDVLAAEGVGRALGLSLVHPALPPELSWPIGASVAGALGGLALQLWGDRAHLTRTQELSTAETERVSRQAGAIALLWARTWCALSLVQIGEDERAEARLEALATALGRALCCDLPPGVAGLLGADRVLARSRALETLTGLAWHVGLRERFDADWFRNPRSAELLRTACAQGNALPPEAVCAELSTSLAAAGARAVELVT